STPLSPQYFLWQPPAGKQPIPPRLLWTKRYIGCDPGFYAQGYRWGVSLGNSPETFKKSALYLENGGINLPDGKYVIAIRANAQGVTDIVLGKEERGIDLRVISEFKAGKRPVTTHGKEILNVANHSMLISRGQPYDPKTSNPEEFSAYFAGEIGIDDYKINYINDQTGQLFGPNGLIQPLKEGDTNAVSDQFMKQKDYEDRKLGALEFARTKIEEITGQKDIHLIKVEFVKDNTPESQLKKLRQLNLKAERAEQLASLLQDSKVQAQIYGLIDAFDREPQEQIRLIKALSKHGDTHAEKIFALTNDLIQQGLLKPEQASKLALELFVEPEGLKLFKKASSLNLSGISENTKRKLLAAYNKLGLKEEISVSELASKMKEEHPGLIKFLIGRRLAGGYVKLALSNLEKAAQSALATLNLLKWGDKRYGAKTPLTPLGDCPEFIWKVETSTEKLNALQKSYLKNPLQHLELLLLRNPFEIGPQEHPAQFAKVFRKNLATLQKIQKKGATLLRLDTQPIDRQLGFIANLFVYAHNQLNITDHRLTFCNLSS
ncbi:MAG: hypothetical protein K2X66_11845, partial [Cyanobacteria bacterium]|nr:hypothetical protein [Cyanobacteriota bacterium]